MDFMILALTAIALLLCLEASAVVRRLSANPWSQSAPQFLVDARLTTGFTITKLEPPSRPNSYWDEPQYQPFFDDAVPRNVTAQLGKAAHLSCRIHQLADRTVGSYTYTSDQRFSCIHMLESDEWILEIKHIRREDEGVYECQASTEPKMSFSTRLSVIAAKAIIPEGPEVFIRSGSTIHLSCVITGSASPPAYVFWYRDGSVINYDSPRGRMRVTTDKGKTTVSRLQISKARAADGGDYACKPSYSDVANVSVHIISYSGGNHQAVHQSGPELSANSTASQNISSLLTSSSSHPFLTMVFFLYMHLFLQTVI